MQFGVVARQQEMAEQAFKEENAFLSPHFQSMTMQSPILPPHPFPQPESAPDRHPAMPLPR